MIAAIIVYCFLVLVATGVAIMRLWLRIRQSRIRTIVQTLASVVSQHLPLSRGIRAAASGERGAVRRILNRIAQRLEIGYDLSTALRASMASCPGHVLGTIEAGERTGTMPAVLQGLAADTRRDARQIPTGRLPLWYPLLLLFFVPLVLAYVATILVPTFRSIFADFGTQLPAMTVRLTHITANIELFVPLLLIALVILLFATVQSFITRHFLRRSPSRFQWSFGIWDMIVWYLPFARTVARNRALERQLPVIQAALRAGHDLHEAARQATRIPVNSFARRRLAKWADHMSAGEAPITAGRDCGLPNPLLQTLSSAREGTDLATRLEYLAIYYRQLRFHWEHLLLSILAPVLVFAWAIAIGFIALALILPIITLYQSVMVY